MVSEDKQCLELDEDAFMSLGAKKQMCVLYRNQVTTLQLLKDYKTNTKIQYGLVSLAITGLLILFKISRASLNRDLSL